MPLSDRITQCVEALQAPISADAPTGVDVTYDDSFRDLKHAVDEMSSASADFDYTEMATQSWDLLTTQSKDVRVGAYFVLGETRVNGVTGMAASLAGLQAMLETHWEAMYPPARRAAARGNALQFIADHLTPWVEAARFDVDDAEAVAAALEAGRGIQTLAMEKLGEHAPALSGLLSLLDRAAQRLQQRADAASTTGAPEDDGASNAGGSSADSASSDPANSAAPRPAPGDGASRMPAPADPSPTVAIRDPGGEISAQEALRIVIQVATSLRKNDPSRAEPYRLLRVMRWSRLQSAPPHTDGKTQLPAPDDDQRVALPRMLDRGAHEQLLEAGEQAFQSGSFHCWLDLQHLQVRAGRQLGSAFAAVADAIETETAALIQRLPVLPTLSFRDGTPFASPTTQGWLETLQATSADAPSEPGAAGRGPDGLSEALAEARTALGTGSLDDAIEVLDAASADDSTRAHFRRRLYTAIVCLDGGRPGVARPLLEALDGAIDAHGLDRWEPALALQAWTRLYVCYTRLHGDGLDLRAPARVIYGKICQIDAKAALSLPEMG